MYDVVIIGGGPAGMMASGRAAERGRSVLLLEKNATLGKKLLITGGGRCNLTNNKLVTRELLLKYKKSDQFLASAFSQFNVKDTLEFFNMRGMKTKEENEGRVFPVSDSSKSVLDVLVKYLKDGGVKIQTGVEISNLGIEPKTNNIIVLTTNGKKIIAKSCVVATGGTSRPDTGSTGDGFKWLKKLDINIVENDFALVPVAVSDKWIRKLSGTTIDNIKITMYQNGQKQNKSFGKILFTHFGISGPTVLNISSEIGELLKHGDVLLEIDVFPKTDLSELRKMLQKILLENNNKKIKNVIGAVVNAKLGEVLLELCNINNDTFCHSVSSEKRKKLTKLMKSIPLHVSHLLGADKAIVSSGGANLEEIDFKTMQLRKIPNIYLVGDVLNVNRPSGGYSLQLCWTTGFVAGNNC
ncbi:MAG: NAD(P)/FAD-dependent oxidoreductase [bacterium]|nr:NAD(P)/FAD-dependent oxidoreductase [bacterium]